MGWSLSAPSKRVMGREVATVMANCRPLALRVREEPNPVDGTDGLSEEQKATVMGGNAAKLLKLEVPVSA